MEKLFELGRELGEAVSSIQDALTDGKVSLGEGFDISKEISSLGFFVFKNKSELSKIIGDGISIEDQEDFVSGFNEGYDISDDETEQDVENLIAAVIDVVYDVMRVFNR